MKRIISLAAGVLALAALVTSCCCNSKADKQQLFIGDNIAVAQTQYGTIRGYILRDVYTFLGVPYGASTAGENRFMAPREPEPWTGIKNTVFYGYVAPQNMDNKYPNGLYTFSDHWNYGTLSEDCLSLNVWTPALDGAKRPVMVWFHGGGFTAGNAIEQDGYNGENFSREGDVVFVSVNHRLGAIGYSDFSDVDPKYADSGNAGTLDMVAALKWVHNNIENFGGDPSNVTIMGQSGGGAKVCILAAMPETEGLISKVVALSGNSTGASNKEVTKALGKFICEKAGGMDKLLAMSWEDYLKFAGEAQREFAQTNPGLARGFAPVADGVHVPEGTFYSDVDAASAKIPMILCSTTAEHPCAFDNSELVNMDWDQAASYLEQNRIKDGKAAIAAYRKVFPDKKPFQIVDVISASRAGVIRTANAKAVQEAPVYLAWFNYNSPLFDGRRGAFHCIDISFWFKNTDLMLTHSGGGKEPRKISEKMSSALLSFMRTGDPNCKGLPEWPRYTEEDCPTMIFDVKTRMVLNPDTEARKALE